MHSEEQLVLALYERVGDCFDAAYILFREDPLWQSAGGYFYAADAVAGAPLFREIPAMRIAMVPEETREEDLALLKEKARRLAGAPERVYENGALRVANLILVLHRLPEPGNKAILVIVAQQYAIMIGRPDIADCLKEEMRDRDGLMDPCYLAILDQVAEREFARI